LWRYEIPSSPDDLNNTLFLWWNNIANKKIFYFKRKLGPGNSHFYRQHLHIPLAYSILVMKTMLSNNVAGMPIDTIKSILYGLIKTINWQTRKVFTLEIDGSKILSNETINKYDNKGNLISEIKMIRGDIFMKSTNEYNNKGQKVKSLILFQKLKKSQMTIIWTVLSLIAMIRNQFNLIQTISNYDYDKLRKLNSCNCI
jgi:hypothetical protein